MLGTGNFPDFFGKYPVPRKLHSGTQTSSRHHQTPDVKFVQLNFQLIDNSPSSKFLFLKRQNYDTEKNILLNRMNILNIKMEKNWIELSLANFKIKCKTFFCQLIVSIQTGLGGNWLGNKAPL